jgi:hypothetical protein
MSKDDKRDKFTRLANNRVNIVLDKLRLIGNLSDKRYYEYSDNDVKAIISSIQKEFSSVKNRFEKNKKSTDSKFHIE